MIWSMSESVAKAVVSEERASKHCEGEEREFDAHPSSIRRTNLGALPNNGTGFISKTDADGLERVLDRLVGHGLAADRDGFPECDEGGAAKNNGLEWIEDSAFIVGWKTQSLRRT